MKIHSIRVVFESGPSDSSDEPALITCDFSEGKWTMDRPIYSRLLVVLHESWKVLRNGLKGE